MRSNWWQGRRRRRSRLSSSWPLWLSSVIHCRPSIVIGHPCCLLSMLSVICCPCCPSSFSSSDLPSCWSLGWRSPSFTGPLLGPPPPHCHCPPCRPRPHCPSLLSLIVGPSLLLVPWFVFTLSHWSLTSPLVCMRWTLSLFLPLGHVHPLYLPSLLSRVSHGYG